MADSTVSDTESDGGLIRAFDMPPENATAQELREALKTTQLEMARLAAENRDLRVKLAASEDRNGGKKKKAKGVDVLGYQEVIKTLGKKFGFMQEPWINPAGFTSRPANTPPHETPAQIEMMFKSAALYLQYITSNLYDHVPAKFHELVDASIFPDFADNFIKHLNAGRSSAANTLKAILDGILDDFKIGKDRDTLLYHPGEDTKRPPSSTPPIFYTNLKKNAQTMFLNPVLPMALRGMLFGAGSVRKQGTAKPQANTLGYIWKLDGLTISSICFTLITILRVLSGTDTLFEEKGKISGIPYLAYFHQYKKLLMKNATTPGVKNILRYWTKIVFQGVSTVVGLDDEVVDDGEAEAAAEAEFAAAMEGMSLGDDAAQDVDFEGFGDDGQDEAANTFHQADIQPPEVSEEPELVNQVDDLSIVPAPAPIRGRGGRATGRGRGRGKHRVVDSEEELEEAVEDIAQVLPRRTRRR
ncbi:hypothetical protein FB451DRAFT_1410403 [Mycena latifolia]|nr:hypothetical protein FB451DRAFT_1410403 [Mycena latifolia]